MKRQLTLWAIFSITVFLLQAGAVAADNFMVNAGTTDSDAFYTVDIAADGGYATFGKTGNNAVTAKFNSYGRLEWARAFEGVAHSNCNSGAAGEDGLFLTGRTASAELWMAKIAPWGQTIWQKTYTYNGYSSPNLMGVAVVPTTDGGCAVSLRANVDGFSGDYSYDLGLAKIAADGSLEWIKFYGTANYDSDGKLIATVDSEGNADGYLLATQEDGWGGTDRDNEVILLKVDTDGLLQWVKAYAGFDTSDPAVAAGNEFLKGVCRTADNGYAVVGQSYSASDPSWSSRRTPYLLKVDNGGNTVWARRFGVLNEDPGAHAFTYGGVAQATDNSDLILAGTHYEGKFWLLRFSEAGGLTAETVYPSGDSILDQLGSVVATADGGGAASRWSQSYGAGDYDGFMMKFDADLGFDGTGCDGGSIPGSEVADMRFDTQDVTANCHVIDSSDQWTVADAAATAYDPAFWAWTCSAESDQDADGVVDIEDNCPATSNADQADGDTDGSGNACDCDLDNSGTVDRSDFMQLRSAWGTADDAADFNVDGIVDRDDYSILRGLWGTAYPWY